MVHGPLLCSSVDLMFAQLFAAEMRQPEASDVYRAPILP